MIGSLPTHVPGSAVSVSPTVSSPSIAGAMMLMGAIGSETITGVGAAASLCRFRGPVAVT